MMFVGAIVLGMIAGAILWKFIDLRLGGIPLSTYIDMHRHGIDLLGFKGWLKAPRYVVRNNYLSKILGDR